MRRHRRFRLQVVLILMLVVNAASPGEGHTLWKGAAPLLLTCYDDLDLAANDHHYPQQEPAMLEHGFLS
jgi:hypothetical protein